MMNRHVPRSTIRISITRLKQRMDVYDEPPCPSINYKNLDYEIETVPSALAVGLGLVYDQL